LYEKTEVLQPMLRQKFCDVASMPGAPELVRHFNKHRIPIAIATSSDKPLFLRKAKPHGMDTSVVKT
jgi:beta-phosphoglucomutase-like phosphatase (HAD superfamily)